MQKPQNFENTQIAGDYTPIELGGHHLIVKNVEEKQNSSGKPMIVVSFDTAQNDSQPGYYTEQYKNDTRTPKKWGGNSYINVLDYQGNTGKQFKSFCTSVERSNPGFTIQWGDAFATTLKNKNVGGVFGEEEYIGNDGQVKTAKKLFWWCASNKVEAQDIPNKRALPADQLPYNDPMDGFNPVDDDDDVPFV